MKCVIAYARLPEDVYGNEAMDRLARRTFAENPDVHVVHVNEHGGWWLEYARGDGRSGLMVVGTANSDAHLPQAARDFCARFDSYEHRHLTPDA